MLQNIISRNIIKEIIIIIVGICLIWLTLNFLFGTYNPFYVVSSGSMIPELQIFDLIIVQEKYKFNEINVGDIIVFKKPINHDKVIVHRVDEIINDVPKVIRTKGDSNIAAIPGIDFPITNEEYIGKVEYIVPQIGHIIRFFSPPINYIIMAIIIIIVIYKEIFKKYRK